MNWYSNIAYSIGGALLLLMLLGIFLSIFMPTLDRWSRRYFITLFSIQFLCVALSFFDAVFYAVEGFAVFERTVYIFGFASLLPLMVMPTVFLMHRAGLTIRTSLLFKAVLFLSVLYLAIVITAQFIDAFYSVTPNNLFVRGKLFPLLIFPLVLITVLNVITTFILRKVIKQRYFISMMVYLLPMSIVTVIHMFISIEFYLLLVVGIWALATMVLVMQENMQEHLRQQKEIAHQHASILMLQMRPHFIYNTMTSIYYLCDQDPAKAKQVTLDFTTYLRKNFAAIASSTTVPFADELEHTRAYLAVEQAQFEDVLFVNFDTPHTLFRLPPLTLQPIVENAVKHGMTGSKDPIHISVITRQSDKTNEIIVEDDGPGYQSTSNDEPHIALNNIRQRLEMMCKGTLNITAREGGGTRVEIILPITKNEEDSKA